MVKALSIVPTVEPGPYTPEAFRGDLKFAPVGPASEITVAHGLNMNTPAKLSAKRRTRSLFIGPTEHPREGIRPVVELVYTSLRTGGTDLMSAASRRTGRSIVLALLLAGVVMRPGYPQTTYGAAVGT